MTAADAFERLMIRLDDCPVSDRTEAWLKAMALLLQDVISSSLPDQADKMQAMVEAMRG